MKRFLTVFALLLLVALMGGCSKKSTKTAPDNVSLTLAFPNDSLIMDVEYLIANVVGEGIATPIRDSMGVANPLPNQNFNMTMRVPAGNDRHFVIQFYDDDAVIIFWAHLTLDIPAGNLACTLDVVQAGFGAATRIKLFRDNLPWNCYAMDSMLAQNGFEPGTGDNQYQIYTSEDFDTVTLVPGVDLVIISNDQNQNFYDNYHLSETRINDFIYNGGTVFWEACDLGWAYGSIDDAGITLPGGVKDSALYDSYNYIVSSHLHLVAGLDSILQGNYASHEAFYNLAPGTISYTVDGRGLPTLISYSHGLGWVLMTGQPLEHAWTYGWSIAALLPRVVRFILGLDPQGRLVPTDGFESGTISGPSSGSPAASTNKR